MSSKSSSKGASSEKIKVVVRVRPLNTEERIRGHQNIIQTNDENPNTVTIWDPTGIDAMSRPELQNIDPSCWARNFSYDHCIHSNSDDESHVSQEEVFDIVGQPVVNWALDGFNSCVLAYGQTGAGKSFTMMGSDNLSDFGLIPRICFGLFEHFESFEDDPDVDCSMEFSFVEIYNETLRDCLSPKNNGTLKVREDPRDGTYITNLTVVAVTTFEDVLSLITVGNRNRSVASTKANLHSSRSHSIVTLTVRQRSRGAPVDGLRTSAIKQKLSKIHLVDLAGSERVTHSGAVGMRLREANHINKSLSVLGDVIKCLGENAKLKTPGHIPYRNSVLTMVLRHSLGGNSRTTMVAAVSPSSMDYEESVSTLKYADNAKKVRMRVAANVSSGLLASDGSAMQLVPILQAEVKKLREMLQAQQQTTQHGMSVGESGGGGEEAMEIVREMMARVEELEGQLQDREKLIQSLEQARSTESFMRDNDAMNSSTSSIPSIDDITSGRVGGVRSQPYVVLADDAIDTTLPRLINLNQDPLFSECLVYYIPTGTAVAGNSEANVDILLSGPDILSQHCLLHNESDDVWISPSSVDAKVYVNGELLQPPLPRDSEQESDRFYLRHFDRISMGRYHLFRFEGKGKKRSMSPLKGSMSKGVNSSFSKEAPGWDFAHDELMLNKDSSLLAPRSRSRQRSGSDSSSTDVTNTRFEASPSRRELQHRSGESRNSRGATYYSARPAVNSQTVAQVVSGSNTSAAVPKRAVATESHQSVSASPPDTEEWWERVTKVADGEVRVNTPSELRAMLRSVVESAEKQFEAAEQQRLGVSAGGAGGAESGVVSGEVEEEVVREATRVRPDRRGGDEEENSTFVTPYVSEEIPADAPPVRVSSDPQRSSVGVSQGRASEGSRGSHRSAITSVTKSLDADADMPPPPPPQASREVEVHRSSRIIDPSRRPSSDRISATGGSAADFLFAERKKSSAATRYSLSNVLPEQRAGADEQSASDRGREFLRHQTRPGDEDVLDSVPPPAPAGNGERFEDEASALQKDMVMMQQKLRDRMQRYKS